LNEQGRPSACPELAEGSRSSDLATRRPEPAKPWAAFLSNHREAIAAMDFFTVPEMNLGGCPTSDSLSQNWVPQVSILRPGIEQASPPRTGRERSNRLRAAAAPS